jgi:hypothetical protein
MRTLDTFIVEVRVKLGSFDSSDLCLVVVNELGQLKVHLHLLDSKLEVEGSRRINFCGSQLDRIYHLVLLENGFQLLPHDSVSPRAA